MAEIGVLEGYKHKEDVPDSEYLRLENQLSFPLYVVAKEIVNAYRSQFSCFIADSASASFCGSMPAAFSALMTSS